ncbi:MAG: hypothetical protein JWN25_1752 [Verrucomicrobiales bacterium]|nr:hypothetical protein [Verrucomicrobiales bacterium]
MKCYQVLFSFLLFVGGTFFNLNSSGAEGMQKPLMKDFMGINGHTVQFKPELYRPAVGLVRDYHDIQWDIGDDTDHVTTFPMARNKVDWSQVYGSWAKVGFVTDVSVMFPRLTTNHWKNLPADAFRYGKSFGAYFGPAAGHGLVSSVEIGNEPGHYSDADYRSLFQNMARGLREGDPKLSIVTCALTVGKSHKYAKSVTCVEGLTNLFDVLNIHSYAEAEKWPTWKRSYPEDPKLTYLTDIIALADWRDKHAAGKAVWLTEFGYDSSTKTPATNGPFAKWIGNTDVEQARYLVRSFLLFSKMPVERAYIYFFDDKDEPQIHGSSGLTRNFVPKPSFYAVAHLQNTLGEYRFEKALAEGEDSVFWHQYGNGKDKNKKILAGWTAQGGNTEKTVTIPTLEKFKTVRGERMPLGKQEAEHWGLGLNDTTVKLNESPVYLFLESK